MGEFKVIIAGGRDFKNYPLLRGYCDYYLSNKISQGYTIEIISGKAKGADTLGEDYALERGYKVISFPADWNTHHLAAGSIRNGEMAEYGDALIAFWDGKSKGTKDMIKQATNKGMMVKTVKY